MKLLTVLNRFRLSHHQVIIKIKDAVIFDGSADDIPYGLLKSDCRKIEFASGFDESEFEVYCVVLLTH